MIYFINSSKIADSFDFKFTSFEPILPLFCDFFNNFLLCVIHGFEQKISKKPALYLCIKFMIIIYGLLSNFYLCYKDLFYENSIDSNKIIRIFLYSNNLFISVFGLKALFNFVAFFFKSCFLITYNIFLCGTLYYVVNFIKFLENQVNNVIIKTKKYFPKILAKFHFIFQQYFLAIIKILSFKKIYFIPKNFFHVIFYCFVVFFKKIYKIFIKYKTKYKLITEKLNEVENKSEEIDNSRLSSYLNGKFFF